MKTAKHPEAMKNPVATSRKGSQLLLLDEEYPLKPWISRTGEHFQTVSVRQDDGTYVALIVEDPETRCSAATRLLAENGVKRRYLAKLNPEFDNEGDETEEDDYRVGREREKRGEFVSLEEFRRRRHARARRSR